VHIDGKYQPNSMCISAFAPGNVFKKFSLRHTSNNKEIYTPRLLMEALLVLVNYWESNLKCTPKVDRLHELGFMLKMESRASVMEKKKVSFIWRILPGVLTSEKNK
jgi:hypothetical protein